MTIDERLCKNFGLENRNGLYIMRGVKAGIFISPEERKGLARNYNKIFDEMISRTGASLQPPSDGLMSFFPDIKIPDGRELSSSYPLVRGRTRKEDAGSEWIMISVAKKPYCILSKTDDMVAAGIPISGRFIPTDMPDHFPIFLARQYAQKHDALWLRHLDYPSDEIIRTAYTAVYWWDWLTFFRENSTM